MMGLGTRLRLLVDHVDGAVDRAYRDAGLDFRARFYPYYCLLAERGSCSIGEFARHLGCTQPSATQTVALMKDAGLLARVDTLDARERRYRLSAKGEAMRPKLERLWTAIATAAARIDSMLPAPLQEIADAALDLLARTPFHQLIGEELIDA